MAQPAQVSAFTAADVSFVCVVASWPAQMILACALVAVALGDGRGASSPRPSKPVNAGKAQANQASNEATPAAAVMKARVCATST